MLLGRPWTPNMVSNLGYFFMLYFLFYSYTWVPYNLLLLCATQTNSIVRSTSNSSSGQHNSNNKEWEGRNNSREARKKRRRAKRKVAKLELHSKGTQPSKRGEELDETLYSNDANLGITTITAKASGIYYLDLWYNVVPGTSCYVTP